MPWDADEIQRRMAAAGLTQAQLAKRLGVSLKAVNNWVTGKAEPRGVNLRKLDRAFGVQESEDEQRLREIPDAVLWAELGRRFLGRPAARGEHPGRGRPDRGRPADYPEHLLPRQSPDERNTGG